VGVLFAQHTLHLTAHGSASNISNRSNYTLQVVNTAGPVNIIGNPGESGDGIINVVSSGGGGSGDGLIFGPNGETAVAIAGGTDAFFLRLPGSGYSTLAFGDPVDVTNDVTFTNCDLMTSLEMNNLETVGGNIFVEGVLLETALFPKIRTVGSDFSIQSDVLGSASLPELETVGAGLFVGGDALTSFSAPLLQSVSSDIDLHSSELLTSINLNSLVTAGGMFFNDCETLVSISLPVFVPTDGSVINFFNCALNATSVEHILRRCVLAGVTTCTIDLSGGTNAGTASLNAQGQADVATLGLQVTMNA